MMWTGSMVAAVDKFKLKCIWGVNGQILMWRKKGHINDYKCLRPEQQKEWNFDLE